MYNLLKMSVRNKGGVEVQPIEATTGPTDEMDFN